MTHGPISTNHELQRLPLQSPHRCLHASLRAAPTYPSTHERLERELDIAARLRSRDSYARLLERFYGWYEPWESRISQDSSPELRGWFAPRMKSAWLVSDLADLGAGDVSALPLAEVPRYVNDAEVLGAMYVMEGSTLGGQIISRMVEQKLNFGDGFASRFYRSYGERTGAMWKEFTRFVEQSVAARDADDALRTAADTFDRVRVWLCEAE